MVIMDNLKYNEDFVKKYYDAIEKCLGRSNTSYSKMAGNIFAMIVKELIESIIKEVNLPYKVSINNSYIKNHKSEWDLLIVEKNASDHGVNVYDEEDVKAIIELKTASYFQNTSVKEYQSLKGKELDDKKKIMFDNMDSYFKHISKDLIDNDKIRYLYITLFQNINYSEELCKAINNMTNNMTNNKGNISVFIFNKDNVYYDKGEKNFKNDKYLEESFSEFIIGALK